jgi:hypothetical protein
VVGWVDGLLYCNFTVISGIFIQNMKMPHKKYLVGVGVLACLILGVVFWKPVVAYNPHARVWKELIAWISNTPVASPIYCPDAPSIMYISGGIPMYSQFLCRM